MNRIAKRCFFIALAASVLVFVASPVQAAKKAKTEDELIADLASPKEDVVADAMLKIEKQFPTSTKAIPEIKKYLGDNRAKVRRKAARVIGVLHADVTSAEIKTICGLFKSADQREVMVYAAPCF